jgi:serine/threonine-protein kinase
MLDALPKRLRDTMQRGLRRDPRARFSSIAELRDQLRPLVAERRGTPAGKVLVALHGIRTQAAWQRALSEIAGRHGVSVHIDRWNFGYFSALRFLMPWSRLAKVRWFRLTYQQEFQGTGEGARHPSIVAHSFGTYILGNALLRYPYLRFDKVLLCGSILPRGFPWDLLIERGQVQSVRNEFGRHDIWTQAVAWFVFGTGPSGLVGFTARHPRFTQERFEFEHSEYFDRAHMEDRWLPFLAAEIEQRPTRELEIDVPPGDARTWGLYILYALVLAAAAALIVWRR